MKTAASKQRAIVVGAGIGGLTAAIALHRAGFDVVVLERSPELDESCAGISLWPNAVHALRGLGLESVGRRTTHLQLRTAGGNVIRETVPLELEARFGAPLRVAQRAALVSALAASLEPDQLRLDTECVAVNAQRGYVRLGDGTTEPADVIVAADGVHSALRRALLRDGGPRYSGYTAWRGVASLNRALAQRVLDGESFGRGSAFGILRLSSQQAYWWASARIADRARLRPEDEKAWLLRRFAAWHDPIVDLIDETPAGAIVRTPLHERPQASAWSVGCVALLGDAAHPMLPSLGQGACQAIEDAVVLADALGSSRDVPAGLAEYERRRSERAAEVVRRSRAAARVAHLRSPLAAGARNGLLRVVPETAILRGLDSILGEAA